MEQVRKRLMADQVVVVPRFQELAWRRAVETHLAKAAPRSAYELVGVIERILKAGPFLHGCHPFIQKLIKVESSGGELEFVAISAGDLVAISEMAYLPQRLLILAVLDLGRLRNRTTGKVCYIADRYFDLNGKDVDLTVAVDPDNRITCSLVTDWEKGGVRHVALDVLNAHDHRLTATA
jgi:hypothetical protein